MCMSVSRRTNNVFFGFFIIPDVHRGAPFKCQKLITVGAGNTLNERQMGHQSNSEASGWIPDPTHGIPS